jgi:hypothetical protein
MTKQESLVGSLFNNSWKNGVFYDKERQFKKLTAAVLIAEFIGLVVGIS